MVDLDPERRPARCSSVAVERGHRLARSGNDTAAPSSVVDAQLVVDEVEVDGEDRIAVDLAHRPGGDARGR